MNRLVAAMFVVIIIIQGYDLMFDYVNDLKIHIFIELLSFLLLLTISLIFILNKIKNDSYIISIVRNNENELERMDRINKELYEGMRKVIFDQFMKWQFTKTETEVAMLLIKGFTFKEIADLRENSEKTIREHASSLYHKAKVVGRAELAAFFLEDIL